MDIWWNPALEEQAIDRVHRIGQRLPVYVTRLMIDNTVEEKIIKLQEKKAMLSKGALGDGSMVKNTKLSVNEIRSLFEM
jgi:SNF2 family DNA or RNA helicase